ncbi:hypothetical protein C8J56DRAFT_1131063, partial [Mycena floridula]
TNTSSHVDIAYSWKPSSPARLRLIEKYIHSYPVSDFTSKPNRDHSRDSVDQRLSLLLKSVIKLRRYRNSLSTISVLPDEILSKVFLEHVLLSDPFCPNWTEIMQVCRRWHDVCMSDMRLWSFLSCEFDTALGQWITRSQQHPVACRLDLSKSMPVSCFILTNNFKRIYNLEIRGKESELDSLLPEVQALPTLHSLDVSVTSRPRTVWQIPSVFVASQLREVHLNEAGLSMKRFFQLDNLTDLSLQKEKDTNGIMPSVDDLLALLGRSPRLRQLKLKYYTNPEMGDFHSTVVLPNLTVLEIVDWIPRVLALLEHMTIPAQTSLNISPIYLFADTKLRQRLFIYIARHLRHNSAIKSFSISQYISFQISLHAHLSSKPAGTCQTNCPEPHFSFTLERYTEHHCCNSIKQLFRHIPISPDGVTIDASVITTVDQMKMTAWTALFKALSAPIKELRIGSNDAMSPMLLSLVETLKSRPQNANRRARKRALPTIEQLTVGGPVGGAKMQETAGFYERLLLILRRYSDVDVPGKLKG